MFFVCPKASGVDLRHYIVDLARPFSSFFVSAPSKVRAEVWIACLPACLRLLGAEWDNTA